MRSFCRMASNSSLSVDGFSVIHDNIHPLQSPLHLTSSLDFCYACHAVNAQKIHVVLELWFPYLITTSAIFKCNQCPPSTIWHGFAFLNHVSRCFSNLALSLSRNWLFKRMGQAHRCVCFKRSPYLPAQLDVLWLGHVYSLFSMVFYQKMMLGRSFRKICSFPVMSYLFFMLGCWRSYFLYFPVN